MSSLVVPWIASTASASTPVVTNYTGTGINEPTGIAAGPDGALWFTNRANNSIGRITTAGAVTNYTGTGISDPVGITAGPDGALWFTNAGNNGRGGGTPSIGRITTGGVGTNYTDPSINTPEGITAGPDGALWFTNIGHNPSSIGRITTGSPPPTTNVPLPSTGRRCRDRPCLMPRLRTPPASSSGSSAAATA